MNGNNLLPVSPWKESMPLLVIAIAASLFGIYEFFFRERVIKEGVFTKATVETVEGYKGGVQITYSYSFGGKQYKGLVGIALKQDDVGKQFFIKLRSEKPQAPVFLQDTRVPPCLEHLSPPLSGWKEMPSCP